MADHRPTDLQDPEFQKEIGCVPMTKEAIAKMSLNPYDQLFICRAMSTRDGANYERFLEELRREQKILKDQIYKDVSEVINDSNQNILKAVQSISEQLEEAIKRLKQLEDTVYIKDNKRIEKLEAYASPMHTFVRGMLFTLVGVGMATLLVLRILSIMGVIG